MVGANNEFILELSDASGSFGAATELDRISDRNTSFEFFFRFSLPEFVAGEGYKMRVRSTDPEITGPESDVFPMYFLDFTTALAIRPQGQSDFGNGTIAVCDQIPVTLEVYNLFNAEERLFNWYKNGSLIADKAAVIQVNEAGVYSVELDYGSCAGSGNTMSNQIGVVALNSTGITLKTPEKAELCSGESVLLRASIESNAIRYTWYKDGEAITPGLVGASSYLVDGAQADFAGIYQVEISGSNLCKERSEGIEINNLGDFNVERLNVESLLLLPGQTTTLSIQTDAGNYAVQWYRDDIPLDSQVSKDLVVQGNMAGTYFARVSLDTPECSANYVDSEKTTVFLPSTLTALLASESGYESCISSSVALGVAEIIATDGSGNNIEVTETLLNQVQWQWFKDGTLLPQENNWYIELSGPEENGAYKAIGTLEDFTLQTDEIEILLSSNEILQISANTSVFCESTSSISLSTTTDVSGTFLTWFHDGIMLNQDTSEIQVTEPGTYELWMYRGACPVYSNRIELFVLDPETITVSPGQSIEIQQGSNAIITADGGDSYLWFDADNKELSQDRILTVSREGTYYLVAQKDGCEIRKTITVSYIEKLRIPNVISYNGDGVNDFWILPGIYAGKPEVKIIIYNSRGQEVFQTKNYQNNWPSSGNILNRGSEVFYYNIVKDDTTLKQGTITIIR